MTETRDLPDEAAQLAALARTVLHRMAAAKLTLATAESCTGGLISSLCTDIEGLGSTFERGFVTYSPESKAEMLGIEPSFIARHGVVSAEVAVAMADGALRASRADIVVSITGFAGTAAPGDEAGLVYLAALRRNGRSVQRRAHYGDVDRDRVRMLAAHAALEMIDGLIE